MTTHVRHPRFQEAQSMNRVYSPDILPSLQLLLADLADIDLACEQTLEAIKRSVCDESLKREKIAQLRQSHEERRASCVAAIEELQERQKACFG